MALHTDFLKEKNNQTNKPIFLYTIYNYDGLSNNLNLAESKENIVFDSITYTAFPIMHDNISDNSQGQTPEIKVKVANVSRLIEYYLNIYDLRDKKVLIRLVWANKLDNPDVKYDAIYYINSYTANEKVVEFTLLPKVDALGIVLPRRTYSRNYCQWRFKSTECGYSGEATECNKTKQQCKILDNYVRFGGFPAIPNKKLYV